MYKGVKGCTRVWKVVQVHSRVYKGIQGCTRVYKGLKGCLRVYKGVLVRKSEYTFFWFFDMGLCYWNSMEDNLSIFWVHSWTWNSKLRGMILLYFFDTGIRSRDTIQDNLSIFWVYIWNWHGKLGGVCFLCFFIGAFVAELRPVEVYRNLYCDPL